MSQKNIALVSNNYWTLYKFRYDVIQMLIKEGYSVHLIAKDDGHYTYFKHKNIHIHFLSLEERGVNIFKEVATFIAIYKLHKKIMPSIIFNFTLKPNIYSNIAARLLNIKTISMITGLGHVFISANHILREIVIFMLKVSLKKTNEIWFTNNFDRDYFTKRKIIKKQRTSIVPGAGAKIPKKPLIKKKSSIKLTFIMIARLLLEKGTKEFLDAANYFKDDAYKDFILIGQHTNDKDHISKKILSEMDEKKIIQYHSYTDNIDKFFSDADCIIHPSYREGVSTVLLEAASHKIPIITTRSPGCIDIIQSEQYGFLCHRSNSKSLIEQIIKFSDTKKNSPEILDSMIDRTYSHILKNFDRSIIINKFKETAKSY